MINNVVIHNIATVSCGHKYFINNLPLFFKACSTFAIIVMKLTGESKACIPVGLDGLFN